MGTIFQAPTRNAELIQSLKTSYPQARKLPAGADADAFQLGELVGLDTTKRAQRTAVKITAANEVTQAQFALPRVNRTTYDQMESGKVTVQKGFFELRTNLYLPNQAYTVGQLLTVRYDADVGGGVFGPVDAGTTTHVCARVELPPTSAAGDDLDMMEITVFHPRPVA